MRTAAVAGSSAAFAWVLAFAGCGLSQQGLVPVGGDGQASGDDGTASGYDVLTSPDGSTGDGASVDGSAADGSSGGDGSLEDSPVPSDASCAVDACVLAPGAGWSLVAFATSQTTACPAGFSGSDVLENPAPGNACTCGTTCQATADCSQISIPTTEGTGCGQSGLAYSPAGGMCTPQNSYFGGSYCGVGAVQVGTSQCTSPPPSQNPAAVTGQSDRICTPTTCAAAACDPSLQPAFVTCLAAAGDMTCPAGAPNKHLVGTPSLSCGICPCTATVDCAGTLTFYTQGGCTGTAVSIPMGSCVAVTQGQGILSYLWTPGTSPPPTCSVGPPSAPSVTLENPQTVCCP